MVLSGVHFPPLQFAPQHSVLVAQAWLSETHAVAPHLPAMHSSAQQSVFAEHAELAAPQTPAPGVHVFEPGSHTVEQHSDPDAHVLPKTPHPDAPRPPSPPEPSPPPPSPESVVASVPPQPLAMTLAPPSVSAAKTYTQVRLSMEVCMPLDLQAQDLAIGAENRTDTLLEVVPCAPHRSLE